MGGGAFVVGDQSCIDAEAAAVGWLPSLAEGYHLARRELLQRLVVDRLSEGCAVGQIAGWLKPGDEPGLRGFGTDAISRFIFGAPQTLEKLWQPLRCGKATCGRHECHETKSTIARSTRDLRLSREMQKLGNWAADLMFCRRKQPVLALHKRTLRLMLAGNGAADAAARFRAIFERPAPELQRSITFDKPRQETSSANPARTEPARPRRGSELGHHALLAGVSGKTTSFSDAPQSTFGANWQKGSVENTNRRSRRQLPRRLDLSTLSQADLQRIVLSLDLARRNCLGFASPIHAFFKGSARITMHDLLEPVAATFEEAATTGAVGEDPSGSVPGGDGLGEGSRGAVLTTLALR